MASLRSSLHYGDRFLRCFKSCAFVVFCCLISFLAFQPSSLAETTIYTNASTYTVFDDSVSPLSCFVATSSTKKITTYSVTTKSQCLTSAGISANTLPKFSDRISDLTYQTKNTFMEAVILLCWSDVVSFMFFCLLLFLFAQVLPG